MRKYLPIYGEAVSHIWLCNCSILNFPIYKENLIFFFISVENLPPTMKCPKEILEARLSSWPTLGWHTHPVYHPSPLPPSTILLSTIVTCCIQVTWGLADGCSSADPIHQRITVPPQHLQFHPHSLRTMTGSICSLLAVAWFSWYCPFYSSSKWHLNHTQTLMETSLGSEITNLQELHTKVTSLRKKDARGHLVHRWQISRSHLFNHEHKLQWFSPFSSFSLISNGLQVNFIADAQILTFYCSFVYQWNQFSNIFAFPPACPFIYFYGDQSCSA